MSTETQHTESGTSPPEPYVTTSASTAGLLMAEGFELVECIEEPPVFVFEPAAREFIRSLKLTQPQTRSYPSRKFIPR